MMTTMMMRSVRWMQISATPLRGCVCGSGRGHVYGSDRSLFRSTMPAGATCGTAAYTTSTALYGPRAASGKHTTGSPLPASLRARRPSSAAASSIDPDDPDADLDDPEAAALNGLGAGAINGVDDLDDAEDDLRAVDPSASGEDEDAEARRVGQLSKQDRLRMMLKEKKKKQEKLRSGRKALKDKKESSPVADADALAAPLFENDGLIDDTAPIPRSLLRDAGEDVDDVDDVDDNDGANERDEQVEPSTFTSTSTSSSASLSSPSTSNAKSNAKPKPTAKPNAKASASSSGGSAGGGKTDAILNSAIKAAQVILLGEDGKKYGMTSLREALQRAQEMGVDLMQVTPPHVQPVVCRLVNYGKFRYQEQLKEKAKAQANKARPMKVIQLRHVIAQNDLQVKLRQAKEFLQKGHAVKVQHMNVGSARADEPTLTSFFQRVATILEGVGTPNITVEKSFAVFNPIRDETKLAKAAKKEAAKDTAAAASAPQKKAQV